MIKHIQCDIFDSNADVIGHQVNCQGVMGSGLAKQIKDRYPKVYDEYTAALTTLPGHNCLGVATFTVTKSKYNTPFYGVYNLFAQEFYGYDGKCYTDYDALRRCLETVVSTVVYNIDEKDGGNIITVAIPYKMGCCRGGGNWDRVLAIINEVFSGTNIDVLICECNKG